MSFKQNLKRREQMELTLPQAVDYFLTALTLEGKSPATLLWHRKKLTAFSAFVRNGGVPIKVCDLALQDGRAFIQSLMERKTRYPNHAIRSEIEGGLAPQTIHGFVRSLRTFASWLQREGYTEEDIFHAIKPPKLPQTLIQPLTEEEIRRLLLAVPRDTYEGVRSYAIVLLFLDTGIRLSELVNLRITDIDLVAGQFKVLGKGAKERLVPMGLTARRAVIRYKEHVRRSRCVP